MCVKKCKGSGLAKGYGCGLPLKYYENNGIKKYHAVHGLCKANCYSDWLLNSDNGKIKLSKSILKVQKPRLGMEQAESERKERTALKKAHDITKILVHYHVRERDKGKPCVSCDVEWNPDFQAGHFYKSENYETLKYHTDNINGQCVRCNIFLDGNFDSYSLNLPKRIGQEPYNALVKLAEIDKQFSKVWNVDNLKEIRNKIKALNNNE